MTDRAEKNELLNAGPDGITPDGVTLDAGTLDLLVDDELDEATRHEILKMFDNESDGWRRCAMAFLEAQSLRAAMTAYSSSDDTVQFGSAATAETNVKSDWGESNRVGPSGNIDQKGVNREGHSPRSLAHWATLAAGLFLAYLVGALSSDFLGGNSSPTQQVAEIPTPNVVPDESIDDLKPLLVNNSHNDPWEHGTGRLSSNMEELFKQLGHRVERRKGYAPVRLDDGRQGFLPWEEIEVVPVVNKTY